MGGLPVRACRTAAREGEEEIVFSFAWRRSREGHSPEWRPANRQSGDWRTRMQPKFPHQLRNSGLAQRMDDIQVQIQLQDIHAGLAEEAELSGFGVPLNESAEIVFRHAALPRHSRDLERRGFR